MRIIKAVAALIVLLQLAACGSESPAGTTGEPPPAKTPAAERPAPKGNGKDAKKWLRAATAAAPTKAGTERWTGLEQAAGGAANRLVLPHGAPPKEVTFKDLRVGKGSTIDAWDRFALTYRSFNYKTGRLEDESSTTEILFAYGVGELVKAWEVGLRGMRVGGTRELIVPGPWAYGKPVVYVVDLLDLVKEG
jgi:FKBP-type peptidyl-prolyl cis-trans isomerase